MSARGFVALGMLSTLLLGTPAFADEATPTSAEAHYAEGLRLLQAGDSGAALIELNASVKLVPSPNTDLLRGHALRTLGKRVAAMLTYERVVRDAGARVREGETRYEAALADAGRWVALLRNELGELLVQIRMGKERFSVDIEGEAIRPTRDPDTGLARIRLWREPGTVHVRVRSVNGTERTSSVAIAAGASRTVSLDVTPRLVSSPSKPAPAAEDSHAPPLASYIAWTIGAAGLGTFAIAGGMARAKMNELDDCSPSCTRDQTNDAKTKATIANVGLGIGIVGVVTGSAIWLGSEATRPSARRGTSITIANRALGLSFAGAF